MFYDNSRANFDKLRENFQILHACDATRPTDQRRRRPRLFDIVVAGVTAITIYIYLLDLVSQRKAPKPLIKWFEQIPRWLKGFLKSLWIAGITASMIPVVLAWAALRAYASKTHEFSKM